MTDAPGKIEVQTAPSHERDGGLRTASRVAEFAAGSALVSANAAVCTVSLGIRAGALAARTAAESLADVVPGAGLTARIARAFESEADSEAGASARRLTRSLELAGGRKAAPGPSRKKAGKKRRPPRAPAPSLSEVAADTVFGSLARWAALPRSIGAEIVEPAVSDQPEELPVNGSPTPGLAWLLDRLPVSPATAIGVEGLRESLVVVTTMQALGSIDRTFSAGESLARLGFGDTRSARQEFDRTLRAMHALGAEGDLFGVALPAPLVTPAIRQRARRIAAEAPTVFLAALDQNGNRSAERLRALLGALVADRRRLGILALNYPQVVALGAFNAGRLMLTGRVSPDEALAYLQGLNLETTPT